MEFINNSQMRRKLFVNVPYTRIPYHTMSRIKTSSTSDIEGVDLTCSLYYSQSIKYHVVRLIQRYRTNKITENPAQQNHLLINILLVPDGPSDTKRFSAIVPRNGTPRRT